MPPDKLDQNLGKALEEMEIDGGLQKSAEAPRPPEAALEKAFEKERPVLEIKEQAPVAPTPPKKPAVSTLPAAPAVALPKSQLQRQIEGVLEEGLSDVYFKLPEEKRQEFKKTGEETAFKITKLLQEAVLKIKEVFNLIFKWLKIIPGVNKYFLEQEAKIKSDRILALKKRMEK